MDSHYEFEDIKPLCAITEVVNSIGNDFLRQTLHPDPCAHCALPIHDKFLCRIRDTSYHEHCLNCSICHLRLSASCYERNGQLYCQQHYFESHSPYHCLRCKQGIAPYDVVYKVTPTMTFHAECHKCSRCGKQFSTGQQVSIDEPQGEVYCLPNECGFYTQLEASGSSDGTPIYADEGSPLQNFQEPGPSNLCANLKIDVDEPVLDPTMGGLLDPMSLPFVFPYDHPGFAYVDAFDDDNKFLKRRGPRTTIKQNQLDVLNRIFTTTPKPSKHARAKLAGETGLSMRVIQVWFQNRRSKERRLKHLCNYLRHFEQRGLPPPPMHFPDDLASEVGMDPSTSSLQSLHHPLGEPLHLQIPMYSIEQGGTPKNMH
ncbi:unnamed protein product, partial [Mesorhabditis spiculigera]